MTSEELERSLNKEQLDAVLSTGGSLLIIAGAGSGKTRVITYRIAHLLDMGVPQSQILALTFTNKAAKEMAERVKDLTKRKLQNLTVSTFHAFGVMILREEIERLGYRKNFSIYDETDKCALIKECARDEGLNVDALDTYKVSQLFSSIKCKRKSLSSEGETYQRLYRSYNEALKLYNCVDFDDLIALPIQLLEDDEVRKKYQTRYQYIMIDEFQDTSALQYEFIRLIAKENIAVVGDDDQSIYSWRGANYKNITNFERDYHSRQIMLTHNYRSTQGILAIANNVIKHNTERKDKKLWSSNDKKTPVDVYCVNDENAEGSFIADAIMGLAMEERIPYSEFGVLMRTNTQSRQIEEALLEANIPYTMSGGISFFERKEIRDLISYLRIIANTADDVNLLRIINTPRRAIGRITIEVITKRAKENNVTLYTAIKDILSDAINKSELTTPYNYNIENFQLTGEEIKKPTRKDKGDLGTAALDALEEFFNLIESQRKIFFHGRGLAQKVRTLLESIGYKEYIMAENKKSEKIGAFKLKNVEHYLQSIEEWEKEAEDKSLFSYLNRITLLGRDDLSDEDSGEVNLMTIHAAKGLEFKVVFIAGCVEGILPHKHSIEDFDDDPEKDTQAAIEEERRLFYVAITRARERLFISCTKERKTRGVPLLCEPSRFLDEIPEDLVSIHA